MQYLTIKKARYAILFMLIGIIIIRFWGLFFLAPTPIKLIYTGLIYFSLLSLPFITIKQNEFTKYTKILFYSLAAISIVQIIRSIFNTDPSMYAFGNKWVTLFGNEYTALIFAPPLYLILSNIKQTLRFIIKASFIYIISCFVMLLIGKNSFAYVSVFLLLFWPYVNKKYKLLIIFTYLMTLKMALDGVRMFAIITLFALASYFIVYILKERFIKLFIILTISSIPILFISTLFINDYTNENGSYFQKLQQYLAEEKGNDELATDTRTFLYVEMAQDLSNTNSWFFGKGALSYYYSFFFDKNNNGKYGRISSEVPFLNYLLRGGIISTSLYFSLLLYAVWCALKYGKNKFIKSTSIIITGWIFNSFIGDITGCTFYHMVFFVLVGCCLNKTWLNYTDEEIKKLLEFRSLSLTKL